MAEDYVETVVLKKAYVDEAIKGVSDRVTAVAKAAADANASCASIQNQVSDLRGDQRMHDAEVRAIHANLNRIAVSVGTMRGEVAGAHKLYLESISDVVHWLEDIYKRVTLFCFICAGVFGVLTIALLAAWWRK